MCNGIILGIRGLLGRYRERLESGLSLQSPEYREYRSMLSAYGNGNLNKRDNSRAKRDLVRLRKICGRVGIMVE